MKDKLRLTYRKFIIAVPLACAIQVMKNKLVIFTADFPFGNGETFLETEIGYLANAFDEVRIISSSDSETQTRSIPENCKVERIDLNIRTRSKLLGLLQVFNPFIIKEISIIKTLYRIQLNKGILSTMLLSLLRAKKVKGKVDQILNSGKENERFFFYSYWCDDRALGLAMAQTKNPEIRTLCRMHGWDVYFERSNLNYLPFRHQICSDISKIFSISENAICYAQKVWKVNDDRKFELARLGVSNAYPMKKIEHDHLLLLSCSSLIPLKRVHMIVGALMSMEEIRIRWIHIGDGPERSRIEDLTKLLPSNVTVELTGQLPNSEILAFYHSVRPDLFINVSESEGIPVSIMEAMSFGLPVIATNVGGTKEIVNNENGRLLNENPTPIEIKSAICELIENKGNLQLMQQNAYTTWNEKYNAELNYHRFIQAILQLKEA